MMEDHLLAQLRARANPRGVVTVRGEVVAAEVGVTPEDLRLVLAKLERAGFLQVLAPLPFLVLKLHLWPGHGPKRPNAYSSQSINHKHIDKSHRHPADAALLREILDTLGETDGSSFEGAIRHFAPGVIRTALDRVRRTKSLRKNRTALFRYLLVKLTKAT